MKKLLFLFSFVFLLAGWPVSAQENIQELPVPEYNPPQNYYYRAEVTQILGTETDDDPYLPTLERYYQEVEVRFLEGPLDGQTKTMSYIPGSIEDDDHNLKTGEKVVVIESDYLGEKEYAIADRYRVDAIVWMAAIFLALVIAFAGWKGARSMLGLAFTILVIIFYILPRVLEGQEPFGIFLVGGLVIAVVSIYLGHGFNRRTSVAVVSTVITLLLSVGMSILAIKFSKLFGFGSEEAFYLQVGDFAAIDLRGLLLGGIIIGILGVLDDITTAQSAVVQEIYRADNRLKFIELARRALSVGHEHIVSLVNTLALAYVGASFPLLILFTQKYVPLWVTLNSERIVEEVARTLIGSSALVLAVPITTYLAAYYFTKFGIGKKEAHTHSH